MIKKHPRTRLQVTSPSLSRGVSLPIRVYSRRKPPTNRNRRWRVVPVSLEALGDVLAVVASILFASVAKPYSTETGR